MKISRNIEIPDPELSVQFICSPGPGGQNVNKVATGVQLRFDAANSSSLPAAVKARLLAKPDRRISRDGVVLIGAHRFRTQSRNRADAEERLRDLIVSVLHPPKHRWPTTPTKASQRRRVEGKKRRGQLKRQRSGDDA